GPTSPTRARGPTSRSRPSSTRRPPKPLTTSRSVKAGAAGTFKAIVASRYSASDSECHGDPPSLGVVPASPARRTALTVLRRVEEQGAFADRALHGDARELDPRDRALAKRLVFGTIQRRGTLDWIIERHVTRKLDPQVRAALLIGLYQLLYTE